MEQNDQRDYVEAFLFDLLKQLNIPQKRIIFLHVKLLDFKKKVNAPYELLSKSIITVFGDLFNPKTILVPTFTYTFTKSGIYHRIFSKSEVGRFSEEIRKVAPYRTLDPIFNVADVYNYLPGFAEEINFNTAFDENSLFHFLDEEDCVIVNFGLEQLVSTQLHYVERQMNVSYRYDKYFDGVIYHDETNYENIKYKYYVRDLEMNPQWNREKIKKYLIENNALHTFVKDNIDVSWISAKAKFKVIKKAILEDEYFLIT